MTFACFTHDERAPDDEPEWEPLMPTGWPRPPSPDGLPVPFIASSLLDLGHVHAGRRDFVIRSRRCQVCGDPLGDRCVVCFRGRDSVVMDGAAIHVRPCWPVALRRCPHLARMHADGELIVEEIDVDQLEIVDAGIVAAVSGMALGYRVRRP